MLPSLVQLRIDIGCRSKRACRRDDGDESAETAVANLGSVERDAAGRIVYIDLQPRLDAAELQVKLAALRQRLLVVQPPVRILERLQPINRGRLLSEINDATALNLFGTWVGAAVAETDTGAVLRSFLEPLGADIRLLGAHWIVPKVTEYDRRIVPQALHTDVDSKGEVLSIAIHVDGGEMGTLIDVSASIDTTGAVVSDGCAARAATSVFGYDTGAVHGGPGVLHVPPPYPRYYVQRVFVLLCSAELDPERVAKHRADNGLHGGADVVFSIKPA